MIEITHESFDSPSEAEALGLYGLIELVMNGYGFAGGPGYANEQFSEEYVGPEKQIFVAKNNSVVVGTLVITPKEWSIKNTQVFYVNGIVVNPQHRAMGIAKLLFEKAMNELDIKILFGNTKTPSLVMARAAAFLQTNTGRTFYGKSEVTESDSQGESFDNTWLLNTFVNLKGITDYDHNFVYTRSTDILSPTLPIVDTYPDYIKKAFKPVIDKQMELGSKSTAVMPIISITNKFLKETKI